jgi:hypothetical protein
LENQFTNSQAQLQFLQAHGHFITELGVPATQALLTLRLAQEIMAEAQHLFRGVTQQALVPTEL